jgi:hypothetical protein
MRRPYRARLDFLFFHYARNGSCKSHEASVQEDRLCNRSIRQVACDEPAYRWNAA